MCIYYMNCAVSQGFPALKKAILNTSQNTTFFTCLRYRQSAADTSLAFRVTLSGWWMNGKAFTILNPRLFAEMFSEYGCWNYWKILIANRQWRLKFSTSGRKPNHERRTRRVNTTKLLQETHPCIYPTRTSCEIKKYGVWLLPLTLTSSEISR